MEKTITVKGVGSVFVEPDYIVISMTVEATDMEYDMAMKTAADRIEALQNAAVAAGHVKKDLRTTRFHVETRYASVRDGNGNFKEVFRGYVCSCSLKLSFVLDNGVLADTLAAIAESAANPDIHISFTVRDPAAVREALLRSAAENARAKADVLAEASGIGMCQRVLQSITYDWSDDEIASRTSMSLANAPLAAMGKRAVADITPEEIHVTDSATFVWRIE